MANVLRLLSFTAACKRSLTPRFLRTAAKMAAAEKPYVYQHTRMHPALEAMLQREFHMVQPDDLEEYREKVSAIFVFVKPPVTASLVNSLPNLKAVGSCAVGYDHVDLAACAARGVRVGYTPEVLNDTTADMAWALLLASARRVVDGDRVAKDPKTTAFDLNWFGTQVSGTTLGIVGMGRIGLEVAKRARGFDMTILYHNRHRRTKDIEEQVKATYVSSLHDLLGQSDHVVLVAPANEETYHLMGQEQFAAMKKTALFINVSRGTLVDQVALDQALRNGTIAGAGLDVTDPEPLPRDHRLLTAPALTLTPHTASATLHTRSKMVQMTIDNIWAALKGQPMINEVKL